MTLEGFLIILLFSTICGMIGQMISRRTRGSVFATVAIGFIGALFGTWLAAFAGLPSLISLKVGFFSFSVIWSILGTILLMSVVKLFYRTNNYAY